MTITRRSALGLGSAAAASAVLGTAAAQADETDTEPELEAVIPRTAEVARRKIARKYRLETRKARGTWSSCIGVTNPDGSSRSAVEERPDAVVEAYSVNKIAVAVTVLEQVDRDLLRLDQRIDVTADIVIQDTDGLELSSNERLQVATKAGWFEDGRNEAGIVFDVEGKPVITFALFASGRFRGDDTANHDDYSATHPALRARTAIGRTLFDSVRRITCPAPMPRRSQACRPWTGA